jgi:hypothetical protein
MKQNNILAQEKLSLESARAIAQKETHCGMCRIDFLGTGLCPSGKKHGFVAYWPQGRMQIFESLMSGKVKPTKQLIEIVNSCPLCGICDKQCNFATQLRPEKVARKLKEYVDNLNESEFQNVPEDNNLKQLREIVGEKWATNDPVIIAAYRRNIVIPHAKLNFYVVMPKDTNELSKIIKFANKNNLQYMVRGGGTLFAMVSSTVMTYAMGLEDGIVIDLLRMKKLEINKDELTATIGPGISAFELQKEAYKHGLRANVAEAGAHVCANLASTGICTTWGNSYGWASDNYVDVQLVDEEGNIFNHSEMEIKNPYSVEHGLTSLKLSPPGILTEAIVKLHPIFEDEEAVFIPFENLKDALKMALTLAKQDVGLSLAVLSRKYLTEFISPTPKIAKDFEFIAKNYMKLNYVVDIICTKKDKKVVEEMADFTIDKSMLKILLLGSPKLASLKDSEFMKILSEEENPCKAIFAGPMKKHLEQALEASPENMSKIYDKDLQDFFKKVYSKPEMSDVVWLHAFRIFPSRLMRQRMFIPRGGVMWADEKIILDFHDMLKEVGEKHNLENALGYISFMEHGKFAVLEYDYYFDHTDPSVSKNVNEAVIESLERTLSMDKIISDLHFYFKGLHRKEHILYPLPKAISQEEKILFKELIGSIFKGE